MTAPVQGHRLEEYRRPDGTWSRSRRDAVFITTARLLDAVHVVGTTVPGRYYVGTAQHESNFALNERDTETSGFQSWGLYQVSQAEAVAVGMPNADLCALGPNTFVMVKLAELHRRRLRQLLDLGEGAPDPADLGAYLAIAHNQGLAAALKTARVHGLDWEGYKRRNPAIRIVSSGYGDDVL